MPKEATTSQAAKPRGRKPSASPSPRARARPATSVTLSPAAAKMIDSAASVGKPRSAVESLYANFVAKFVDLFGFSMPGARLFKVAWVVNLQKGATCFWVAFLMWWFGNYTLSAYVYLGTHGTYGIVWLLKDITCPDANFQKRASIWSLLSISLAVLGPYWYGSYATIRSFVPISNERVAFCIFWHTIGVMLMMVADTQKYFTLQLKKGLISNGWFARSRNMNYFGEIMVYSTYGIIAQSYVYWGILLFIWSVLFTSNMITKELSLRQKDGFEAYAKRSWMLIPKPW